MRMIDHWPAVLVLLRQCIDDDMDLAVLKVCRERQDFVVLQNGDELNMRSGFL